MISDKIWKELEKAILGAKHSHAGAPGKMSDRAFFEALLYLNRTGTPWRDLPAEFGGAWKTFICALIVGLSGMSGIGYGKNSVRSLLPEPEIS